MLAMYSSSGGVWDEHTTSTPGETLRQVAKTPPLLVAPADQHNRRQVKAGVGEERPLVRFWLVLVLVASVSIMIASAGTPSEIACSR